MFPVVPLVQRFLQGSLDRWIPLTGLSSWVPQEMLLSHVGRCDQPELMDAEHARSEPAGSQLCVRRACELACSHVTACPNNL